MRQKAKKFYELQLHDNTSVVGRMDKDEIIELMAAFAQQQVKNLNIPAVSVTFCDYHSQACEYVTKGYICNKKHEKCEAQSQNER